MKNLNNIACILALTACHLAAQSIIYESGGKVGIGTPTPDAKLVVAGNGDAASYWTDAQLHIAGVSDPRMQLDLGYDTIANLGIIQAGQAGVGFKNLGLNPNGGNVGIGTANPTNRFHVQVNASDTGISLDDGGLNYNPVFVISRAGAPRLSLSATSLVGTVSGRGGNGLALSGNNTTQDVLIAPSGNIGIGATGSAYRLSIDSGANSYTMRARAAGDFIFALAGDGLAGTNIDLFSIRNNNTNVVHLNTVNGARMALGVSTSSTAGAIAENLTILSSGNVGIGTTNPTQKLSVNGTIRAKEVVVETSGWSDYVFSADYQLESLSGVEAKIKEQGHLPGIPSTQEVAEKGVSLGEMQAKLLSKVEELTLHAIKQEKRIEQLEAEVKRLSK